MSCSFSMANVLFLFNYKHSVFYIASIVLVLNFLHPVFGDEDVCPDYECNFMQNDRRIFTKVELGSKYLYPTGSFTVKSISSESVCSHSGKFEGATVDNMTEFRHIVHDLIQDRQLNLFGISPSVIVPGEAVPGKAGVYSNPKTKQNMKFHFFNLKDGQYFEPGMDCVAIEARGENYFYVPKICIKGDSRNPLVIPVCQYPQSGKCQLEGIVTQNAENGTEFYQIGRYYGSTVQKPWEEAKRDCENRQMDLLHFSKTSLQENDHPWADILSKMPVGPNEWFQAIWTAGKFKEKFGEDQEFEFLLKDSKTSWSYKDSLWKWSDAKLIKSPQEERCLAVVDTCPITIRSVSCELPNYYICVERSANPQALQVQQANGNLQQKSTCFSAPKRNYIRECDAKSWSPCECRKDPLCRYNGPSQRCEDEKYFCQRKLSFRPGECVRTKGYYMVGGSICQSQGTDGLSNCLINEPIQTVNLFGPEVTDKYWVKYRAGSDVPFDDLYQIAMKGEAGKDWFPEDKSNDGKILYGTYLWAQPINGMRSNLDVCITYQIQAMKQGMYELALKLADTSESKHSAFNSFNVKFNNVRVLWEVDFTKFLVKEGGTVDLLLNYEIKPDKKTLLMKAQPDTVIYDELIPLDICLSECQDSSVKNWQFRGFNISAFSVLWFDNSKKHRKKREEDDIGIGWYQRRPWW